MEILLMMCLEKKSYFLIYIYIKRLYQLIKLLLLLNPLERQQKMIPLHFSLQNMVNIHVENVGGLFTELPLRSKRNFRIIYRDGGSD